MDTWYFDVQGQRKGKWMWTRVGHDGSPLESSRESFRYYLEVLDDARRNGFDGEPRLGSPPSPKPRRQAKTPR